MKAEDTVITIMGIDGKLWSEEFCKRFPQCQVDDVLGWFCNAIMAGYDAGVKAGIKEVVEWIKFHNELILIDPYNRTPPLDRWSVLINKKDYEAKLKEWGL